MTQAQQPEALRLAAICETKGMFPVADELNRMHARILELEQGKCLHQIAEPAAVHPDDVAVDALAALMKAKLAKQRVKGYGGWDTDCTQERLSDLLRTHVNKGDPVDVANFCAFLAARGEMICLTDAELINAMEAHREAEHQRLLAVTQPAPQAVQPAIMPKGESAAAQLRAMATNYPAGHSWDKLDARACIRGALEIEALRALLAAAPAHPAEGVNPVEMSHAQSIAQQAQSWVEVFSLLRKVVPNLTSLAETGEQCALAAIRELAATQPAPQAVQPAVPQLKANCYSDDDGDYWRDCPDDCDFVEGLEVGDTYELQASIRAWSETFRVTKAPDETSDDYEVELVSSNAPAHPAEGVPAQAESKIGGLLALARNMVRTALDADNKTEVQEIKAAIEAEVNFERGLRAALAATQPAAQAVPVLYVSKGQLDNHRDPDGVDTDGAGRYLPARKTPKGNFTAPLYERPAPAAQGLDAQDAARYRWLRNESWACYNIAKKKPEVALVAVVRDGACNVKMVLAEDAMDTAVDAALAAQAKQGGAA